MKRKFFNRDFTLLWLGQSVSQLGDGAGYIGLMWWIVSKTGSATLLGLMAVVRTVTGIAVAAIAGTAVDRLNRKAIIVSMDVVRGLAYGLMVYLISTAQMTTPWLLGLVAVNAVCSEFFAPAITASVPLMVKKRDLPKANSMLQITRNIVSILSYSAGGVFVALFGVPLLLAADAASFLLSALSEVFINIPEIPQARVKEKQQFFRDLKDGIMYIRSNKVLMDVMKVAAILNFFAAPIFLLLPKFVKSSIGGSASLYGYLLAASMVGTLGASMVISFTNLVEKNIWSVIHGITIQAGTLLVTFVTPWDVHWIRIVLFAIAGFFNGVVNIYFQAVIQRVTAPEHLGKVSGFIGTMCMSLQPLSQGLAGVLGDRVPIISIYMTCSTAMGAGGWKFSRIPNLQRFLLPEMEEKEPKPKRALATSDG